MAPSPTCLFFYLMRLQERTVQSRKVQGEQVLNFSGTFLFLFSLSAHWCLLLSRKKKIQLFLWWMKSKWGERKKKSQEGENEENDSKDGLILFLTLWFISAPDCNFKPKSDRIISQYDPDWFRQRKQLQLPIRSTWVICRLLQDHYTSLFNVFYGQLSTEFLMPPTEELCLCKNLQLALPTTDIQILP